MPARICVSRATCVQEKSLNNAFFSRSTTLSTRAHLGRAWNPVII